MVRARANEDIESSGSRSGNDLVVVETAVAAADQESRAAAKTTTARSSSAWKWLVLAAASLACFLGTHYALSAGAPSETVQTLVVRSSATETFALSSSLSSSLALSATPSSSSSSATTPNDDVGWHIKPIHPHHNGRVVYLAENTASGTVYKRIFTVPCHYGMLVFNVGPAAKYEPYSYDVYEDAYAYSDNKGLCILYPSWTGVQTSTSPLWTSSDPTDQKVGLGDTPTKISTRVVKLPNTKDMDAKRGGDFVIMRSGNFYNPGYYKHLKSEINRWPGGMDVAAMEEAVREWVAKMETGTTEFAAAEEVVVKED